MSRIRSTTRAGFTLVELLVVIVIIGILASIISVAVIAALKTARNTAIRTEIDLLHGACETYKNDYGSYPPSNVADLKKHIQSKFPYLDATELTKIPANLDNAEILVYCLQGYGPNTRKPISTKAQATTIFEFDKGRLQSVGTNGQPVYTALHSTGAPYVYFDTSRPTARSRTNDEVFTPLLGFGTGFARAYFSDLGGQVNPQSFQIICAGQDGAYSKTNTAGKSYPSGLGVAPNNTPYEPEDLDNLANFSPGVLGDQRP